MGIAPLVGHRDRKVEDTHERTERQVQAAARAIGDDGVRFGRTVDPHLKDQFVLV